MRSGRGKCPQCKEIIVVDLDAAEIRCPLCHALLKQSSKTVAEVKAEEEARIAAAEARARELAGETEETAAPQPEAPVEETVDVPVQETQEETPVEETVAEELDVPTPAESEEPVDEIGISDEELAAMDEALPEEEAAEEQADAVDVDIPEEAAEEAAEADIPEEVAADEAPAEEPVDEIGISDEELAAMDTPVADEAIPAMASPAPVPQDEDESFADIDLPEQAEEQAEAPAEEAHAEEGREEVAAEETPVEDTPAEDTVEEAIEESAEEAAEEAPEAEEPAEDIPEAVAAEEAPAEEIEIDEPMADDIPVATNEYVPSEEDMAFAASLSDGIQSNDTANNKKGYFASAVNNGKPAAPQKERDENKKERAPKEQAPKGEKTMSDSAIYKKPVAVIMMILALVGAAFSLLYTTNLFLFGLISENVGLKVAEVAVKIAEVLPKSNILLPLIFAGVLVLISVLGLTGKRGKVGFVFALLASLIYLAVQLFGGADPIVKVDAVAKILTDYSEYVTYAVYGLVLLGAIFFAVSLGAGREDLEISGGTIVLPIIYMLIVVVGYVALVILPKMLTSFTVSADIIRYSIFGIVGLSILLTLIGVHSNTASRGANAWLLFASTMIVVLLTAAVIVLTKVVPESYALDLRAEIVACVSPCIIFFPLIGYAISDLRN